MRWWRCGFVLALNASGAVNFAHGDLVVLGGAAAVLAASWTGLPGPLLLRVVVLAIGLAGVVAARSRSCHSPGDLLKRPSSPPSRWPPSSNRGSRSPWAQRRAPRRPCAGSGAIEVAGLTFGPPTARHRRGRRRAGRSRVAPARTHTQIGRRMRAVAADRYMARAVGIPVGHYIVLSLALAGALAGVAGFLLGHQFLCRRRRAAATC
jgi:branched-chain amino acid transport system permease protein